MKQERLASANALLQHIASCGRHFFAHKGEVSRLEIDHRGRLRFHDSYTNKRIYLHTNHAWHGFTEGGTLRGLIVELKEYVMGDRHFLSPGRLGPWPAWLCEGDLWGYGDAMGRIRETAQTLGLLPVLQQGEQQ